MKRSRLLLAMAALGGSLPAFASVLYSCASNIDATQAGTCGALNGATVSGVYSGIFSNVNANIYIQYGNTGVGSSSFNVTSVPYAEYYAALAASSTDSAALASLTSTDPLLSSAYGNTDGNISVTAALANALGLGSVVPASITAGIEEDGVTSCTLGSAGCYNGVITISNGGGFNYPLSPSDPAPPPDIDFFYVVEHETDEILGTSSCIGLNGADQCPGTDAAPADLFRYAAAGTPTFLATADGTPAYFSIDGGVTSIAPYINSPLVGDYGDWEAVYPYRVQDGEASPGTNLDLTNDGGSEIAVLDAVGFNLVAPEPGTLSLFGASLGLLLLALAWRRRQS